MKKKFVLIIVFLFVIGINSAVIARNENDWTKSYQKNFGKVKYYDNNSVNPNLRSAAYISQKGRSNYARIIKNNNFSRASINQVGSSNTAVIKQFSKNDSALIKQVGSNNKAVIIQN